jgi:hypothetical protein
VENTKKAHKKLEFSTLPTTSKPRIYSIRLFVA